MHTKEQILDDMALYRVEGGGIGSWLTPNTCDTVFQRLGRIDNEPLAAVQLNQLLVLSHEAPVSDGFFKYYWLDCPDHHPYSVRAVPRFRTTWGRETAITSLDHLAWGLHRLYIDGLLYFGNVRTGFRTLRNLSYPELQQFFATKRLDTDAIKRRGPPLPLRSIPRDKRYLISEMACKSYGDNPLLTSELRTALNDAYSLYSSTSTKPTTIRALLANNLPAELHDIQNRLTFSASEILDAPVTHETDISSAYACTAEAFDSARKDALANTRLYLSMLTDLDVYVATSMRTPDDFVRMSQTCDSIFANERLQALNLRYFDPTLSAANGHEDKGLIECLMVKCAKALVYCGGEKESYGKDAEAAMALSLGRPVIFYCEHRADFYREVHPLTRLIQFDTGVAVGAMVTGQIEEATELLCRVFENRLVYRLERTKSGSLRLKEDITGSVVRLQTSDTLLTETFWNHYHQDRDRRPGPNQLPAPLHLEIPTPVVSIRSAAAQATPQRQAQLNLQDTTNVVKLAARSPAHTGSQPNESAGALPAASTANSSQFPLSEEEVFDGISQIRRHQASGAKRFAVFSKWLRTEKIDIIQGASLLRFAEAALKSAGTRANFVYTHGDLTRWYQQMSEGHQPGT